MRAHMLVSGSASHVGSSEGGGVEALVVTLSTGRGPTQLYQFLHKCYYPI